MRLIALAVLFVACIKAEQSADTAHPGDGEDTSGVPDVDPLDSIDEDSLPAGQHPCREPVKGVVDEIIDGDTIKVKTGRGVERVRLIGIDAPEVDHSGPDDDCYGEETKNYLDDILSDKTVWLTFDSECEDDYDRSLAYVHRGVESDEFIQRLLLMGGWASTLSIHPNVPFRSLFSQDQVDAQDADAGMWGDCR